MTTSTPQTLLAAALFEFSDDRAGNQFRVTLKRAEPHAGGVSRGVSGGVSGGVNGGVKPAPISTPNLMQDIQQNPGLRTPALANLLDVTPKKVAHWISQLRDDGQIEFVGTPKTGGYHSKKQTPGKPS